jgi:hypothetical protein
VIKGLWIKYFEPTTDLDERNTFSIEKIGIIHLFRLKMALVNVNSDLIQKL